MKRCLYKGKKKYATAELAKRAMLNIMLTAKDEPAEKLLDLMIYKCHHCGTFHVGHRIIKKSWTKSTDTN